MRTGNPIISNLFTADPTVLAWNDTVYLYTGHDEAAYPSATYVMKDWLCFSSKDLATWTAGPHRLKATDFLWAQGDAYASKVIHHKGKFYWYVSVTHSTIEGKAIGVAVANDPLGPFTDARGSALITGHDIHTIDSTGQNFDPTVLVDDNGSAYLFWGKDMCYYAQLGEDMISLQSAVRKISLPGFMEGAHLHKRGEWYYLSYGYGSPEKVGYAMSRSIHGPWEFKGILNELAGNCETNRPAILPFRGKDYFFYHNGGLKDGGSHRRSVCLDYLYYNDDGTMKRVIMTSEGVRPLY
ncbi:glycoside hydrolase [Paraflavitalea soli]|uniref:Glycoside hydrolase n=1 Tax=Paraflavitalea soli TaxID=2315862 RepID=A0A3B7MH58_9BACT|nr:glycoside hydrolase family 43 protein [Paraflavitalea soli]AXY72479.1 glycoside hydrolase [Paraflavitalea soli]